MEKGKNELYITIYNTSKPVNIYSGFGETNVEEPYLCNYQKNSLKLNSGLSKYFCALIRCETLPLYRSFL